ncbi:MAG: MFS transporter, partial [Gaiella sp.]
MTATGGRVREAATTLARSFANPQLRRLQLAWLGSSLGNWSYLVALSVFAYDAGGAGAVGLVWVIRLVPAALLAAPVSALADRYPRRRVMIVSDLARAGLMGAAAVVIAADGPAAAVYALAVVATLAGVPFRPAQSALLPRLARDPAELTAANAASSTIESVASFAGPALGGLLLAIASTETVFALNAATFVWSAALVAAVHAAADTDERPARAGLLRELTAGAGTIARDRPVRTVTFLYTAQTLVAGAMNVLVVLAALELLDTGEAGVGYLNAALGVGGVAGGFVALVLAGRGRLAGDLGLGLVLFGLPLAALGLVANVPAALIALTVVGVGNAVVDVSAITLLQRLVPDDVLARVLGTLEGLLIGAIGIGAALAPALAAWLGVDGALLATGLLLPVLT